MSDRSPLVLVPGLLCTAELWAPQIAALGDMAAITVADHTSHDSMAAIAEALLAAAPSRFALAGLSMGGYIAFEVLRRAPERVERLALLDTWARPDTAELRQRRLDFIELTKQGRFRGVSDDLLPFLIHPDRLGDRPLVETVYRMAADIGPEAFRRQQTAILNRPDSRAELSAIACPTLVLCGRQDLLTPLQMHEEMAAAIPGAELVVVEACGHLATLERPEPVNAALRKWFLA